MRVFEIQPLDYDVDGLGSGISNGTVDSAFRKIQKNHSGFFIWRIENINAIAIARDIYATFYSTDCYIVYAAAQIGTSATIDSVVKEIKGAPEIHIHFWLGSSATADKSGVSAYKTIELDGYLGGNAVLHRETQGNESPRFKSYFKNGIRVLVDSPQTASKGVQAKLFQIRGTRIPIMTQLVPISWEHFSSGGIFLLETENIVFVWIGRTANAVEKLHSAKLSMQIKQELGLKMVIYLDDGYEQTISTDEKLEFQKYLPLEQRVVSPYSQENSETRKTPIRLYKCTDNNGKYRVTELKIGPLLPTDLESDDVFILDYGVNGIWVWVGKRASNKERIEAMRNARGFVKKKKYPNDTKVTRVLDGSEPTEFKMLFSFWKEKDDNKASCVNRIITKYDALTMHERPALSAETQLIDDGSGSMRIWRINNSNVCEVTKDRFGSFYSDDCYIIWYNYKCIGIRHLIYFWSGIHASKEDIECAIVKVEGIDSQLNGSSAQIRITEGREPAQFLQLFKGKLIIYRGTGVEFFQTGKKNSSNYLFKIEGKSNIISKATEVCFKGSSLNSNHSFVLKRGKHYYIWCGYTSTGDQREMAKNFIGKDFEIILEGKEPSEFWEILGGKTLVSSQKVYFDHFQRQARLFRCSLEHIFIAEEIFNYQQTDLIPEEILLLDTNETIFIWIGKLSKHKITKYCLSMAEGYIRNDPTGKDPNTTITLVKQDIEPPNFIGFFKHWDSNCWKEYKSLEDIRRSLLNVQLSTCNKSTLNGSIESFDRHDKYPINVLKEPSDKLPNSVDPLFKELHLTHDDFVSLFSMQYKEFEILPRWKQQELKKRVGLF